MSDSYKIPIDKLAARHDAVTAEIKAVYDADFHGLLVELLKSLPHSRNKLIVNRAIEEVSRLTKELEEAKGENTRLSVSETDGWTQYYEAEEERDFLRSAFDELARAGWLDEEGFLIADSHDIIDLEQTKYPLTHKAIQQSKERAKEESNPPF